MIIPGFGMISHVISSFSDKAVFGYLGNTVSLDYPHSYVYALRLALRLSGLMA